jgi:hypothetical protein
MMNTKTGAKMDTKTVCLQIMVRLLPLLPFPSQVHLHLNRFQQGLRQQRQPRLLNPLRHPLMMACPRYLRVVSQTVGPWNSGSITDSNGLSRTAKLDRESPTMSQA